MTNPEDLSSLKVQNIKFSEILKTKKIIIPIFILTAVIISLLLIL